MDCPGGVWSSRFWPWRAACRSSRVHMLSVTCLASIDAKSAAYIVTGLTAARPAPSITTCSELHDAIITLYREPMAAALAAGRFPAILAAHTPSSTRAAALRRSPVAPAAATATRSPPLPLTPRASSATVPPLFPSAPAPHCSAPPLSQQVPSQMWKKRPTTALGALGTAKVAVVVPNADALKHSSIIRVGFVERTTQDSRLASELSSELSPESNKLGAESMDVAILQIVETLVLT
jgi:hypothetical protein